MAQRRRTKKSKQLLLLEASQKDLPHVEAPCKYYDRCGGCDLQHFSTADQQLVRERFFTALAENAPAFDWDKNIPIKYESSPKQLRYRQRMDFMCHPQASGLRGRNFSLFVIGLDACQLVPDENFAFFDLVVKSAKAKLMPCYDQANHTGYMRYVSVRRTREGEQMVNIITSGKEAYHAQLAEIMQELIDAGADAVYHTVNATLKDDVYGQIQQHLGKTYIRETLNGKTFLIGPHTFFQANKDIAEKAYSHIEEFMRSHKVKNYLDLYSGTCTMPILFSEACESITAVENSAENIEMAKMNFAENEVTNVDLHLADVRDFLADYNETPDFAVLNPPRSGMDEKVLRRILDIAPPALAYLSCHPKTLMEDLGILLRSYKVIEVTLYDMFPQTAHFETLVFLEKK